MKLKKLHKQILISTSLITTFGLTSLLAACHLNYDQLSKYEQIPTLKEKVQLNRILAADFIKNINQYVNLPTHQDLTYTIKSATVDPKNENSVIVKLEVSNSEHTRTYTKIYGGFKDAKDDRIQKANQTYLNDPKNQTTLFKDIELVNTKVEDLTVDDALKLSSDKIRVQNDNKELNYSLVNITKDTSNPNSVIVTMKITKGVNDQLASVTYTKKINNLLTVDQKKAKTNNLSIATNTQYHVAPTISDELKKAHTAKEATEHKEWFKFDATNYEYTIDKITINKDNPNAVDLTINLSVGSNLEKASHTYTRTIDGFKKA
ncbi:hypothetical protein JM47_02340 [Ureaplasma diversum]|uniref:Lipoprotein n=1 Tax=Ureaplasma diversum TaxID=42094 RepID=A0A0C5S208_9BACT|nr:hypothetical protein [Ureaplasma diversum]AJQ45405.1 hypothetical protein JM47_02340 [Ureaplasma diversum]